MGVCTRERETMRTFYKRVKLTHRTRDLHRYNSARSETVDVNSDDPSNRKNAGALVIWTNPDVAPGLFLSANKRALIEGSSSATNSFSSALACVADVNESPSEEDIEVAERYESMLRKAGSHGKAAKSSHAGKG